MLAGAVVREEVEAGCGAQAGGRQRRVDGGPGQWRARRHQRMSRWAFRAALLAAPRVQQCRALLPCPKGRWQSTDASNQLGVPVLGKSSTSSLSSASLWVHSSAPPAGTRTSRAGGDVERTHILAQQSGINDMGGGGCGDPACLFNPWRAAARRLKLQVQVLRMRVLAQHTHICTPHDAATREGRPRTHRWSPRCCRTPPAAAGPPPAAP